MAIEVGMVLSNEPGYYMSDQYGVRLENLVVVRYASDPNFLCFETLTLCPFDRRLIRALIKRRSNGQSVSVSKHRKLGSDA